MKILLIALLFLAACATVPKSPVGVQCFVKRGNILMKADEVKLYPQDKIIGIDMKNYDACMVIKLSPLPAYSR